MAKRKIGFIQKKAIWTKVFKSNELDLIWYNFQELFEDIVNKDINWNEESYQDYMFKPLNSHNEVPFIPETDRWDDTEGIKPKTIKKLINLLGSIETTFKFLKEVNLILPTIINNKNNRWNDEVIFDNEDNSLNQNLVIKILIQEESDLKNYFNSLILKRVLGKEQFNDNYYNLSKIEVSAVSINKLKEIIENKILPEGTILTNEVVENGISKFYKSLEKDWIDIHSFVPKDKRILVLDPKKFNFKSYSQAEKLFDNFLDKENLINFYKSFGEVLPTIVPFIKNDQLKKCNPKFKSTYKFINLNKSFIKIIQLSKKGIDLQLSTNDLYYILLATQVNSAQEKINSKDRITFKEYESIIELGSYVNAIIEKEESFENFENIDIAFDYFHDFKKYNISKDHQKKVLDLLSETSHIKVKDIPILSGYVGDYKYEMLEKNDVRGLICGKITNCCQHLDNVGRQAVYYGAKNENSTFFIISKKDKIIGQSWVWIKEHQFTFDSTELLHVNNDIKECYFSYLREAKDEFKKNGIAQFTVGSNRLNLTDKEKINSDNYLKLNDGYIEDHQNQTIIDIEKI